MICRKCGQNIGNMEKFCPVCGAPQVMLRDKYGNIIPENNSLNMDKSQEPEKKKKTEKKKKSAAPAGGKSLKLAAAVLAIIVAVVWLFARNGSGENPGYSGKDYTRNTNISADKNSGSQKETQRETVIPTEEEVPETEEPVTEPPDVEIEWHDGVLEARVRELLAIPQEEPVMSSDAKQVEQLILTNEDGAWPDIESIEDLQYFTGLTYLDLSYNSISDISVVAGMPGLMTFGIIGNQVSDLSPLADHRMLRNLNVASNDVSDISPLSGLELEVVGLNDNRISDISVLSGMFSLRVLNLAANEVYDLSPLEGLTQLQSVYVSSNPVEDFSPVAHVPNVK